MLIFALAEYLGTRLMIGLLASLAHTAMLGLVVAAVATALR